MSAAAAVEVRGMRGCVSTPHQLSSEAALDVLVRGGNAVDAAVVAAMVAAVVQPFSSGVGGGGWATVHHADTGVTEVLEFHGRVPYATRSELFTPDAEGLVDGPTLEAAGAGLLGSLVPGAPAGWAELLASRGTWSFADALQPAIGYAEAGFMVSEVLHNNMNEAARKMRLWPASAQTYLRDGYALPVGAILRQPDLAATLRTLATVGPDAAYTGDLARTMTSFYQEHGGTLTMADLADYRPRWAAPLIGHFRGHRVVCAPAPLGDVAFIQGLHLMDRLPPFAGPTDPDYVHFSLESAKLVRRDRARHLGESPLPPESFDWLTGSGRIGELLAQIGPQAATTLVDTAGPSHTITLVVVDGNGDAVHLMQTIGAPFGSGAVVDGTGIVTNSSLYFAHVDPTLPNSVCGGRRLEQNPCVAMVFDPDGTIRVIVGSPGGKTRVETVRQMLVNVLDFGMNIQQAVDSPRFLSDPDGRTALLEPALARRAPELAQHLAARGHHTVVSDTFFGSGQGVTRAPSGLLHGGADHRMESAAMAF
ncbi:gamma-glutamyltransferase family protein [Mycolicibacterium vaccae]|nr:gamma-glutamyltransferase [Mycolicibacterium vaccae]